MPEIHISEYLKSGKTQKQLAELLGCNQSNVSHMLKDNRDVRLVFRGKKFIRFFEIAKPRKSKLRNIENETGKAQANTRS